jgi:ATP-dependent DNA helicase RecG
MIDLCKEDGLPEPYFEVHSGELCVTFKFKVPIGTIQKSVIFKQQLTTRQEAILSIIKEHGSISLKQLADELENPPSERMIRNDLNLLKQYGLVDIKGSARSSLWVLKSNI